MRYPTAAEMIHEYGQRCSTVRCDCCDRFSLWAIRYPDSRGTLLLCSWCDVDPAERWS